MTLWLWRSENHLQSIHTTLDDWCLKNQHLGAILIILFVIPLFLVLGILKVVVTPLDYKAFQAWAPETFPLLHSLVVSFLPILVFVLLTMIESGIYLAVRYRTAAILRETWTWQNIGNPLILTLISLVTVFNWIVLAFQLRVFTSNPAWYWKIERVTFTIGDLWFLVGTVAFLALAYWLLLLRRRIIVGLLFVFLFGVFLELSVGIISSNGLDTVAKRYFSSYHKTYVQKASQNQLAILEVVRRYDELYGSHAFVDTKPPGLMAFYIGLEQLVNSRPSAYPDDVRYERLSTVITYAFPLLAMVLVFLVYMFIKRCLKYASGTVAVTAPLMCVVCPNLVLFSLFPDQAVYPLLFLLGIWLIITIIQRQSLLLAVVLGIFLYGTVFFAFTMLPLYVFAGIYLIMNYWSNRRQRSWKQQILFAGAIAFGSLLLFLVCLYFLNYNFFPRFEKTMGINHNFDFYLFIQFRFPPDHLFRVMRSDFDIKIIH